MLISSCGARLKYAPYVDCRPWPRLRPSPARSMPQSWARRSSTSTCQPATRRCAAQWPHVATLAADPPATAVEAGPEDLRGRRVVRRGVVELGVKTICDPSCMFLGRDIDFMRRVSRRPGLQVVPCTGIYTYDHLPVFFISRSPGRRSPSCFVHDIERGDPGHGDQGRVPEVRRRRAWASPRTSRRSTARWRRPASAPARRSWPTRARLSDTGAAADRDLRGGGRRPLQGADRPHAATPTTSTTSSACSRRASTIGLDRFGLEMFLPFEQRIATALALLERGYADRMFLSADYCATIDWYPVEVAQQLVAAGMVKDWTMNDRPDKVMPALREGGMTRRADRDDARLQPPALAHGRTDSSVPARRLGRSAASRALASRSRARCRRWPTIALSSPGPQLTRSRPLLRSRMRVVALDPPRIRSRPVAVQAVVAGPPRTRSGSPPGGPFRPRRRSRPCRGRPRAVVPAPALISSSPPRPRIRSDSGVPLRSRRTSVPGSRRSQWSAVGAERRDLDGAQHAPSCRPRRGRGPRRGSPSPTCGGGEGRFDSSAPAASAGVVLGDDGAVAGGRRSGRRRRSRGSAPRCRRASRRPGAVQLERHRAGAGRARPSRSSGVPGGRASCAVVGGGVLVVVEGPPLVVGVRRRRRTPGVPEERPALAGQRRRRRGRRRRRRRRPRASPGASRR